MMYYYKLKDGSSVESYSCPNTDLSNKTEITEQEYNDFIDTMPEPVPPEKTDLEKLIEHAKEQKWI